MRNSVANLFIFVLGVTIGSAVTWRYAKKRYEQIADEEINSVKEVLLNKKEVTRYTGEDVDISEKPSQTREKTDIAEYDTKLHKHDYTKHFAIHDDDNKKEEEVESMGNPYVISPEDFGEFSEYEKISLTYYADQILVDEYDELIEDVEATISFESLTHFGEYEEDSVFVRNDRLKCDYEILLDRRTFSSLMNKKPHHVEG